MSTATEVLPADSPWYGRLVSQVFTRYGLAGLYLTAILGTVLLCTYKLVPDLAAAIGAHAKNQAAQTEVLRQIETSIKDVAKCQEKQVLLFEGLRRDQAQALQDHREMMACLRQRKD